MIKQTIYNFTIVSDGNPPTDYRIGQVIKEAFPDLTVFIQRKIQYGEVEVE